MTFDTQLPTNFATPNPPIRKEGAIPSILHRRQAGSLKLNHSAVLTRQDGDTVPARRVLTRLRLWPGLQYSSVSGPQIPLKPQMSIDKTQSLGSLSVLKHTSTCKQI